ncbi:hypothetical protein MPSI1_002217 [Malassezia psittaci]|uniref:Uncharacterized protein n=1 Tax=Malassezia psittaci TaxID=1821823 RepID=A0AAF0F6Z0_9BASI|nr:hypothetical protein MPSI1_002217 [Malassezia psittaci]
MPDLSRVMSNREYDKFLKEQKADAFKKCDAVVQGLFSVLMQNSSIVRKTDSYLWPGHAVNRIGILGAMDSDRSLSNDALAEAEKDYLDRVRPASSNTGL